MRGGGFVDVELVSGGTLPATSPRSQCWFTPGHSQHKFCTTLTPFEHSFLVMPGIAAAAAAPEGHEEGVHAFDLGQRRLAKRDNIRPRRS